MKKRQKVQATQLAEHPQLFEEKYSLIWRNFRLFIGGFQDILSFNSRGFGDLSNKEHT